MDYSVFYSDSYDVTEFRSLDQDFDFFISAYNPSDRVAFVFREVKSREKFWVVHPEYSYQPEDLNDLSENYGSDVIYSNERGEQEQVENMMDFLENRGLSVSSKICFDITGFMRHVIIYLIFYLKSILKIPKVYFLYSEPSSYKKQSDTVFSHSLEESPRSISGIEFFPERKAKNYAIVSVGYDDCLISQTFNNRGDYIFYPIYAFPSLGADMYQQSVIRTAGCEVAGSDSWLNNKKFAPANDPFLTAQKISEIVKEIDVSNKEDEKNIFLCAFSTKAQTLGMSLYWLYEGRFIKNGVDFLMPEWKIYATETGVGIKKISIYEVEFDWS